MSMISFFKNHRAWWSNLACTFIGSLLGIGVTFAISDYIQDKHQERMSRRLLLMSVKDMYYQNTALYNKCQTLFRTDSIFWALRNYHNNHQKMPKDSVRMYFNAFNEHNIFSKEPSFISGILKTNVEILDVVEDLSVINDIARIYDMLDMQQQAYDQMISIRNEICYYNIERNIKKADDLFDRFVDYQFEFKKLSRYLILFHLDVTGLKQVNEVNKQRIYELQLSLNIADEELEQLKSHRLKPKTIVNEQKKPDLKYKQSIGF